MSNLFLQKYKKTKTILSHKKSKEAGNCSNSRCTQNTEICNNTENTASENCLLFYTITESLIMQGDGILYSQQYHTESRDEVQQVGYAY
jgi:hypothetical protein